MCAYACIFINVCVCMFSDPFERLVSLEEKINMKITQNENRIKYMITSQLNGSIIYDILGVFFNLFFKGFLPFLACYSTR